MRPATTKKTAFDPRQRKSTNRKAGAQARVVPLTKSRLTNNDLEKFRQDIIRFNKQKQYKVLAISAMIFIALGAAWYLWLI